MTAKKKEKKSFDYIADEIRDARPTASETAARKARETEVRTRTANITPESAIQSVVDAGLKAQRALAGVQEELLARTRELEDVKAATELAQAELETLYNKGTVAKTIEELVAEYDDRSVALEDAALARQEEVRRNGERITREYNELAARLKTEHERDEANYAYALAQKRKADEDAWQESMRVKKNFERDRSEALVKEEQQRLEVLKASEKELTDLRAAALAQPEITKKEVEKAVAFAINLLKKDLTHAAELAAKDAAADKASFNQQILALRTENQRLLDALAKADLRIEAAEKRTSEIATQAVQANSGRQALDAIQAMKNVPDNGATRSKS